MSVQETVRAEPFFCGYRGICLWLPPGDGIVTDTSNISEQVNIAIFAINERNRKPQNLTTTDRKL